MVAAKEKLGIGNADAEAKCRKESEEREHQLRQEKERREQVVAETRAAEVLVTFEVTRNGNGLLKGFLLYDIVLAIGVAMGLCMIYKLYTEGPTPLILLSLSFCLAVDIYLALQTLSATSKAMQNDQRIHQLFGRCTDEEWEERCACLANCTQLAWWNLISNSITLLVWFAYKGSSQSARSPSITVFAAVVVIRIGKLVPLYMFSEALKQPQGEQGDLFLGKKFSFPRNFFRFTTLISAFVIIFHMLDADSKPETPASTNLRQSTQHSQANYIPLQLDIMDKVFGADPDPSCPIAGLFCGLFLGGTMSYAASTFLVLLMHRRLQDINGQVDPKQQSSLWWSNFMICWMVALVLCMQGPCDQKLERAAVGGLTIVGVLGMLIATLM